MNKAKGAARFSANFDGPDGLNGLDGHREGQADDARSPEDAAGCVESSYRSIALRVRPIRPIRPMSPIQFAGSTLPNPADGFTIRRFFRFFFEKTFDIRGNMPYIITKMKQVEYIGMNVKEPAYAFRRELDEVHKKNRRDPASTPMENETAVDGSWCIVLPDDADPLAEYAAKDLQDYFQVSMNLNLPLSREEKEPCIVLEVKPASGKKARSFEFSVT